MPLLALALPWVGHRELRGRGTVCGSLAHADPAAELPAVAACLNATLDMAGPGGRRTVSAREFFTGPMSTVLAPDELLLGARFPVAGPEDGFGFAELARRHGDFALTGVAVWVRRLAVRRSPGRDPGRLRRVRPPRGPRRNRRARRMPGCPRRAGGRAWRDALTAPMSALAAEIVDTPGDMHASNGYRRRLFSVLAARELAAAYARAARPRAAGPHASRPRRGPGRPPPAAHTPADARASTHLTVNGEPVTLNASPG